jgi:hypothetical protein
MCELLAGEEDMLVLNGDSTYLLLGESNGRG